MAVNLSPVGGVAAQFFDNSGNVLTGGKIYTYTAGTTTPQVTYTSATGVTAHSNPIILDASGRVPGGEIWLTDGLSYKFLIKTSTDVLIGTYDNVIGINSNFINFLTETEIQTATAGQTVFTLTTMQYQPNTNSLSVFVDGVNQYDGVTYAYVETDSVTVTFTAGLHVGALVKFTTAQTLSSGVTDASLVTYDPPFANSVPTNVELKLSEFVSVLDFGADNTGAIDSLSAFQTAVNSGKLVYVPPGEYYVSGTIEINTSYSGLVGHQQMPRIRTVAANGPIVKVAAVGSTLNEFSRIENIIFYCNDKPSFSTTPNSTNCGVAIDGSGASVAAAVQRFKMSNCRVIGFSCGINMSSTVNTLLERIYIEQHTDWSAETGYTAANLYVGVNFDLQPYTIGGISPQASIECVQIVVNGNNAPSAVTSQCFRMVGLDPRDIFFDRCETAGGNFGWYIVPTGTAYNIDVHIRRPIIDAVKTAGIYILNWLGYGALTIDGGYVVRSEDISSAAIWIENSNGVVVTGGMQILGVSLNTGFDDGIRITNSTSCSVVGNLFENSRFGISLEDCFGCVIANNVIAASAAGSEPAPTLSAGIRLIGTCTVNSIIGNSIFGASATYKYANAILTEVGSTDNQIIGNSIDVTTVTTQYNIASKTNLVERQSGGVISVREAHTQHLISYSGTQVYQGNSVTYPHQFKDGLGANLVALDNAGSWIVNSDKTLKENIEPLPYGLNDVLALQPKFYNLKTEKLISDENNVSCPVRIGLIAQDVKTIIPEIVKLNGDVNGLDYTSLIPVLINAIHDLNAKIENQQGGAA
jgi:parallel beta-helix repeat protein